MLLLAMFGVLFTSWLPAVAVAQDGDDVWSTPFKLFEGVGSAYEPALAADRAGALHAVWWYKEEGYPTELMYARWQDGEWTTPVDIVAQEGTLQGPSVTVDRYGRVHLIWGGPGNSLFYASADATRANSPHVWTSPVALAYSNPHAQIIADQEGGLHIAYPALLDGGVHYMSSADGGRTWTAPVLVAAPIRVNATTDFARLAVAPNGDLHVVWTELTLPLGWPPLGVYYARSTDGGESWSEPVEFAADGYLEVNVVAADEHTIHVAWNGMASITGRYHRWSADGGVTWSQTKVLASPKLGGGSTNPPGMAVDSEGTVHVVVNTTPSGRIGGDAAMYVYGRGNAWSAPLDVSQQAPGYIGLTNETSAIAVSGGNLVSILFVDNGAARLWHTWKYSSAAVTPPVAFLPELASPARALWKAQEIPAPLPTRGVATHDAGDQRGDLPSNPVRQSPLNPGIVALVSVLPPLALIVGVFALKLAQGRTGRRR